MRAAAHHRLVWPGVQRETGLQPSSPGTKSSSLWQEFLEEPQRALPALGAAHIHTRAVGVGVTQSTSTALVVPNWGKIGLFRCVFHTASAQGPSQIWGFETNPKGMVSSLGFPFGKGVPTASSAACPGWSLSSW